MMGAALCVVIAAPLILCLPGAWSTLGTPFLALALWFLLSTPKPRSRRDGESW